MHFITGFFMGIVAICVLLVFLNVAPFYYIKGTAHKFHACESSLPRTQHCVLTAVPRNR